MEIWKFIWIVVLTTGLACFVYISIMVIVKGFAEVRALLKETMADESTGE